MSLVASEWITNGPVPFRIRGDDIQTVEFLLFPADRVVLQPDTFLCSVGGVRDIQISWGRRLLDPMYRAWSGEASVLQELVCSEEPARVVLGAPQIGRIVRYALRPGRSLICHRGAFIAGTGQVDIGIALTRRVRAGLFGGGGAVFQRISGDGDVFLHALGNPVDWTLPAGRLMRVSTRNILAFEDTVGYDVQLSGGAMTLMFGGQGAFLSQLEGPGRVIVQSMDHARPLPTKPGSRRRWFFQREGSLTEPTLGPESTR